MKIPIFISENINLTENFFYNNPTANVIVMGNITSDHDISFRVNNLIVLGKIETKKILSIHTNDSLIFLNKLRGDNGVYTYSIKDVYGVLVERAIEKIHKLNLTMTRNNNGRLTIQFP